MNEHVEDVFDGYPFHHRMLLLQLREMIYDVASKIPEVGELEESIKWGQPSYVPINKVGSPIRLDHFDEDKVALLFHCQTSLISDFKTMFKGTLSFSKNRAIVLELNESLPREELAYCIEKALTYHLDDSKIK